MTGLMIPFYIYPGSQWTQLGAWKKQHPNVPIVAIVNPASGPGSGANVDYTNGIAQLKNDGVIVIGYCDPGRGNADPQNWKSWYPNIDGIFIDMYGGQIGICNYAHSIGMSMVVVNQGASSSNGIDVVCAYENYGPGGEGDYVQGGPFPYPDAQDMQQWINQFGASKTYVLIHSVTSESGAINFVNLAKSVGLGWVFVTDLTQSTNPWLGYGSYCLQQIVALDTGSPPPPTKGKIVVTTNPTPANITVLRRT